MNQPSHAVVVGAGVCGLTLAWWLHEIGWRVTVVERAPGLRDGGYMLGLSGPGLLTARRMGLVPALRAIECEIGENVYRDQRGREVMRIRYRELLRELDWITLRRGDLVRALAAAVRDRCALRLGSEVAGLEQDAHGVALELACGTRLQADLVIAADGVHSALRARHFGGEGRFAEHLGYRYAAYDVPDRIGLGRDFVSYAAPGHQVEYHGLGQGRMAALHVWRSAAHGPLADAERMPCLRRLAATSHPEVGRILDTWEGHEPIVMDDLTMIVMPTWRHGRLLLAGDAAHSLSLVSGQGAGMAMASAALLARELGRHPLDRALASHDAGLRPIVERLQARSRKLAPVYVPATPLSFALRNTAMRVLPRALLRRYFLSGLKSEAEAARALEPA